MSGHSHWAGIKHKKGAGRRQARQVVEQAGQGDHRRGETRRRRSRRQSAPPLRYRRRQSPGMPKDNIQRAIKRGTGELDGGNLEEVNYEGYGAGGVAILCEVLTDNRNRTAGEIRKIFELRRRQARRHRLRRLDVREQGPVPHSGRRRRGRQADGAGVGGRRRGRAAHRRQIRGHLRPRDLSRPVEGAGEGRHRAEASQITPNRQEHRRHQRARGRPKC